MKLLKQTTLTAALLAATACQNSQDSSNADTVKPSADISLRATSDIQTPSPVKAATFVPNSVASWLGHIILLDSKGTLHRATTDSNETEIVALGKYADVIGLAREKQSGVFLALTAQGQVKAFVQSDNEGNFSPLAVSQGDERFERFCASSTPAGDVIWAKLTSKTSQKLSIDIFEDTSLTIGLSEAGADEFDLCEANNALTLSEDYSIKPNSAEGLLLTSDEDSKSVEITNGLSISGVKDAGFVTVTSANMGSVYSEGVILVADEDEGRLVLISRAYALKELTTP